ncbi:MAG: type II toxin-antitoxin system ParD family antitoxin [Nitrospirales bacterium]
MKQRTITFEPSEQDAQFIAGQLQEGSYKTQSELIRAGIRRLEEDDTKLKALRHLIEEGEQSGEPLTFVLEEFLGDMRKKYHAD